MARRFRRRKLIKTSLQLRLTTVFVGVSFVAALFQVILMNRAILALSRKMPADGDLLLAQLPALLGQNLLLTVVVLVPIMLAVGILATHRIAGPVYRFETYLGQVARGEDVGPCRLRKGDELQELCQRINEAVTALRARGGASSEAPAARASAEAA
jgi:hypothetical protein